jgi:hypothetical protein
MGELYLDNFERLLVPEWQNEHDCSCTGCQEAKAGKDSQRGQSFPLSHLWPGTPSSNDDRQKTLLSSAC